eukprot:NODE_1450_length_2473_cov_3.281756.p1 GENE.NODE_1450_length_2473_cov_3.281756~~NODE_1450_length_2473_cov_3.281756.p1  ORF type:complete len:615 (-),score=163.46 NODE_1450_length_2473_cov_3.281756:485-2329(-)
MKPVPAKAAGPGTASRALSPPAPEAAEAGPASKLKAPPARPTAKSPTAGAVPEGATQGGSAASQAKATPAAPTKAKAPAKAGSAAAQRAQSPSAAGGASVALVPEAAAPPKKTAASKAPAAQPSPARSDSLPSLLKEGGTSPRRGIAVAAPPTPGTATIESPTPGASPVKKVGFLFPAASPASPQPPGPAAAATPSAPPKAGSAARRRGASPAMKASASPAAGSSREVAPQALSAPLQPPAVSSTLSPRRNSPAKKAGASATAGTAPAVPPSPQPPSPLSSSATAVGARQRSPPPRPAAQVAAAKAKRAAPVAAAAAAPAQQASAKARASDPLAAVAATSSAAAAAPMTEEVEAKDGRSEMVVPARSQSYRPPPRGEREVAVPRASAMRRRRSGRTLSPRPLSRVLDLEAMPPTHEWRKMIEETRKEVREIRAIEAQIRFRLQREEKKATDDHEKCVVVEIRDWRTKESNGMKQYVEQRQQEIHAVELTDSRAFQEFKRDYKLQAKEEDIRYNKEMYMEDLEEAQWRNELTVHALAKEQQLLHEHAEDISDLKDIKHGQLAQEKADLEEARILEKITEMENVERELAKEREKMMASLDFVRKCQQQPPDNRKSP